MKLSKYLPTLPETHNIAVFVGAMARGKDDFADSVVDEKIAISEYPLSASVACGKVSSSDMCIMCGILTCGCVVLLRAGGSLGHHLKLVRSRRLLQIHLLTPCFFSFDLCLGNIGFD